MLSNNTHTLHVPGLQNNNNMVEKIYENKSLKTQSSLSCKIQVGIVITIISTNIQMKKKKVLIHYEGRSMSQNKNENKDRKRPKHHQFCSKHFDTINFLF